MTPVTRGTLPRLVALLLLAALVAASGCMDRLSGRSGPAPSVTATFPPATSIQGTLPAAPPTATPGTPARTPVDLSRPPATAAPYPTSAVDPIVGKWYAPSPDDLTIEFHADGTFTEWSPNFRTARGTWRISEEGEAGFYDADILDRWGYRKQAHILYSSGTLFTKGMGEFHRVQ